MSTKVTVLIFCDLFNRLLPLFSLPFFRPSFLQRPLFTQGLFSPFSGESHIEALFQQYAYSEYAKMIKELVYITSELITEIFVRKNSRTGW